MVLESPPGLETKKLQGVDFWFRSTLGARRITRCTNNLASRKNVYFIQIQCCISTRTAHVSLYQPHV